MRYEKAMKLLDISTFDHSKDLESEFCFRDATAASNKGTLELNLLSGDPHRKTGSVMHP